MGIKKVKRKFILEFPFIHIGGEQMSKLKLYFIDNNYIDYLRKFDGKVTYNKVPNRPYVGVVYEYNNFKYFSPLSSPKKKHLEMKESMIDIFKIKGVS